MNKIERLSLRGLKTTGQIIDIDIDIKVSTSVGKPLTELVTSQLLSGKSFDKTQTRKPSKPAAFVDEVSQTKSDITLLRSSSSLFVYRQRIDTARSTACSSIVYE